MKTVMQLLSLLLCFEFIIAPVQGSLLISSAQADDAKTCPAGQQYEASVNRCLTKNEVLKVNEATQSCGTDKGCYEKNAKQALSDKGEGYSDKVETGGLAKAGTAVAVAIPLVIVTSVLLEKRASKSGAKFTCNPPSLLLMYGAAAALGVGEIYGYFNHKAKLKKIQDQWDATVVPKDESGVDKKRTEATEAQSQAFEFLAQNEEQVGKTAKTKKGFYLAATGLFAAGAIAATVEAFQLKAAQAALINPVTTGADKEIALKTINRLSCYQDKDEKRDAVKKEMADQATKDKNDQIAADKAEKAAKAKGGQTNGGQTNTSTNNSGIESQVTKYKDGSTQTIINTPATTPPTNTQPATTAPATAPQNPPPVDGSLDGMDPDCFKNGTCRKPSKKSIEKMKRVAAYNLSTAKNAEQYLDLMKEFESIEFENYSKAKYVEVDQSLQQIEFTPVVAKMIAEVLVPSSHAQGLMAAIPLAMPLLGGMKNILNILKFNGGKPIGADEMGEIQNKSKSFIIKAISKPVTRIAINGVLGGWMAIQTGHMGKQQKLAEDRAKKLRSMKEDFVTANGLLFCKEEDREDTSKPKCYCYTADNKVNPSRSSTATCKNALATLATKATDSTVDKVCVTTAMAMDSTCACRSTNTCLKTTSGFTSMGFSPNTFKMISANSGAANDLFNGNASAGDIADSAGINAARTQAAAANAIAGDSAAVKESKAAADAFEKGMMATTSGLSMGGSGSSSPLPSTPAAAAAALDKEIEKNNEDIQVTNSGKSDFSPTGSSDEPVPEFGMTPTDAANQEIEIAEVMGKEVDFGSNDINKAKDTNLFETLSNRYQRSGMRRLFEDGKPAPADAPAKSDISN